MIKRILDERKAVKAQMSSMRDKSSIAYVVLDRRQNALKICANSVYGMMGFKNSRYFGHSGMRGVCYDSRASPARRKSLKRNRKELTP